MSACCVPGTVLSEPCRLGCLFHCASQMLTLWVWGNLFIYLRIQKKSWKSTKPASKKKNWHKNIYLHNFLQYALSMNFMETPHMYGFQFFGLKSYLNSTFPQAFWSTFQKSLQERQCTLKWFLLHLKWEKWETGFIDFHSLLYLLLKWSSLWSFLGILPPFRKSS